MTSMEFKTGDMECQSNSMSQDVIELKEYIYMGLSDSTSTESSTISNVSEDVISLKTNNMISNFKETELRLGLPGSESPGKDLENCQLSIAKLDENLLFPVLNANGTTSQKIGISSQKRGFSVAMIEFSEKKYTANSEASAMPSTGNTIDFSTKSIKGEINYAKMKDTGFQLVSQEQTCAANKSGANYAIASNNNDEPPAKVQAVGWPPIRSFRTNMLKNNTKEEEEEDAKKVKGLFVKVSMDGAPYLRKIDLRVYSTYHDLSSALKIMFSCFTLGRYGSHGPEKETTSENKLKNMPQNGCEYLLTYEDKDGDLMLLGDVPWGMFIDTCKRMRIMKGLDAVGLAPRSSIGKMQKQELDGTFPTVFPRLRR